MTSEFADRTSFNVQLYQDTCFITPKESFFHLHLLIPRRDGRGPRAEHQTISSRSRSIKPMSRFFAIPQVASFAALEIRLSKFISQTHVLVSLPPR